MIILEHNAKSGMLRDAVNAFPDECCGFFFGKEELDGSRIITHIQVVNNSKEGDKRRRFLIAAADYLKAEQFADENNLQLLGVYHSHPNHPAVPSEHDRVAAQPYFSYIIISVLDKKQGPMRSWRLNDDFQFEEESIKQFQYTYY